MDLFIRATAAVLVAVIMFLIVDKHSKEMALLLTVCVCCMLGAGISLFAEPVVEFILKLSNIGKFDTEQLEILMKVIGIGFLAEITALICNDAGNATMGKMIQILSACAILWLSIPLLNSLLTLVQQILGEL